jgi:hypothetical protein
VFVEQCPTSLDSDDGGDNTELIVAAGGSFIGVLLLAVCAVGGYLCYRRRQERNEDKEEQLVEQFVPWEEDEPAYEAGSRPPLRLAANPRNLPQDHDFWEWARDWATSHPIQGEHDARLAWDPIPGSALEGLPPPPQLMRERAPEALPQLGLPPGARIEEVGVEEDPQFWEWAREWSMLRAIAQPEAPPIAPADAPQDRAPQL